MMTVELSPLERAQIHLSMLLRRRRRGDDVPASEIDAARSAVAALRVVEVPRDPRRFVATAPGFVRLAVPVALSGGALIVGRFAGTPWPEALRPFLPEHGG